MRNYRLIPLALAILILTGLACGGGGNGNPADPGSPGNETHYLRAKIDGEAWSVPASGLNFGASHTIAGLYVIIGQPTGGYRIQLVLSNITGTGTYPLGVGAAARGGTVTLSLSPATWTAPLSGDAGSITFTHLSDTLMVGTFHFTATPVPGAATGTKSVTDGEFHMPVTTIGSIGPVPDNAWSEVRAMIAGDPWNAANIATNFGSGTLSIVAFTNTRTVTMTFAEVQGPGTYEISSLPPLRYMTAIGNGVDPLVCCWGPYGAATGSVTITSITSTRIQGTFEASLEPSPGGSATGTLAIASGTFDNGLIVAP